MVVKTGMSVAEFERSADQFGPCELVRGEVEFLSPAGFIHGSVTMNIGFLLGAWARRTRRGRVVGAEVGIVTEQVPGTVRGADVAYVSYRRLPRRLAPEGFARIAPNLVVEVVGRKQSWKRVTEKVGEYLRMGVDRVWVNDPKTRRLHVFRPDAEPGVVDENETLTDAQILPGFRCRVRDFFA